MAYILDYFFIVVYIIAITLFRAFLPDSLFKDGLGLLAISLFYIVPIFFYDLYFEYLLNGQTPGKKLMKIRVVRVDGEKPELQHYAIRWSFRIVENIFFFGGSVAMSSFLLSRKHQRLGDLAAGTAVIKITEDLFYSSSLLRGKDKAYVPFFKDTSWASRQDIQLMYYVLHRIYNKYPDKERVMLAEIAEMLSKQYMKENPASGTNDLDGITNTKLIRLFAFDYNYYESRGDNIENIGGKRLASRATSRHLSSISSQTLS